MFRCANFLEALEGRAKTSAFLTTYSSDPNKVNCSDCAAITVTFANILGGNLSVTHIDSGYALNKIKSIGHLAGVPAWSSFAYHAFATNTANEVYDACLEVNDGVDAAAGTENKWLLPAGMVHQSGLQVSSKNIRLIPITGSTANSVLQITRLYQETDHDGIVTDECTLECTNITGNNVVFSGTYRGRSISPVSFNFNMMSANNVTLTIGGIKILDCHLVVGPDPFLVGDKFKFDLVHEYKDYQSKLAAPDWKLNGLKGRTPAGTFNNYDLNILE